MRKDIFRRLQKHLPFILLALSLLSSIFAFADVGNQNRYSSGGSSGGDGDLGMLIGYLIGLFVNDPATGLVVLILLIGHGLNLVMGALSILVHAVRLNTLEFSSAKGISWSGNEYVPFNTNPQGN